MPISRQTLINIVSSIAFVVVFSLVSTYVPRQYFYVVIFVYLIALMSIMSIVPRLRQKKIAASIANSGPILMRVDSKEGLDMLSKDTALAQEMKSFMGRWILWLIIPFILWFTVFGALRNLLIPPSIPRGSIEMFERYLILFSILSGIMYGLRYVMMPRKMIIPVTQYEVRRSGIISSGFSIKFPIDTKRYEIRYNIARGFVEIYDKSSRQAYRFYTRDPVKLRELIERYGLEEKEQEREKGEQR